MGDVVEKIHEQARERRALRELVQSVLLGTDIDAVSTLTPLLLFAT